MKECRQCKTPKESKDFSPNKYSKDGLHCYCKSCIAENRRKRYKENPNKANEINEKSKEKLVEEINRIKADLGCKLCPEKEPVCLDFHHLDSEKKEKSVSNFVMARSRKKALKEISKCVCLCSNCHRKVHAGLVSLPCNSAVRVAA